MRIPDIADGRERRKKQRRSTVDPLATNSRTSQGSRRRRGEPAR
jgi:hypothetical protein